jgi:filamentous hemagglutinin family protein
MLKPITIHPKLALSAILFFNCVFTVYPALAQSVDPALPTAIAQVVPDDTLPVNSRVTPGCVQCVINGGTERGVNLYHSFREFSVPTGGEAWFNNGSQIQNILTRVTGSNLSNIDGLLKTNGTANLFFLNPNGIVFGPNARLQIGGSFLASTANSFKFSDGSEFSATTPQAPPLLTINVPMGLQYGTGEAALTNEGILSPGQDLTLAAGKIVVKGTLTAERDLTLQGNQSVAVDASSTLFSGRDTVVRALEWQLGNADYTTGRYFSTQRLDGRVVDFVIPHGQVIQARGDVTVSDYTGAPLYILAGGKVQTGNITINAPEIGSVTQSISNGAGGTQTITVKSHSQGFLDIRAGINWNQFLEQPDNRNTSMANVTFGTQATGSDITVGQIRNSQGNVLLTNQYQLNPNQLNLNQPIPNQPSLNQSGGITFDWIDTSRAEGNGGAIALSATGDIISRSFFKIDNFSYFSNDDVVLGSYSGTAFNGRGLGGAITLTSTQGNIRIGSTTNWNGIGGSIFTSVAETGPHGGNVTLNAPRGEVSIGGGIYSQTGSIAINAQNDIKVGNTNGFSSLNASVLGGGDDSGNIALISEKGSITVGAGIFTNADGGTGNAGKSGNILLQAGDRITVGENPGFPAFAPRFGVQSISKGDGTANTSGNITLRATNDIRVASPFPFPGNDPDGNGSVSSESKGGLASSRTGVIQIESTQGSIMVETGVLTSSTSTNGNSGVSGNIRLKADKDIKVGENPGTDNLDRRGVQTTSRSETGFARNSGNIELNAGRDLTVINGQISSETWGAIEAGKAGDITLKVGNILTLPNMDSLPDVSSEANASGNGGKITLHSSIPVQLENRQITSSVSGSGKGGTIQFEAPSITLIDTQLQATTSGSGQGGDILFDATNIALQKSSLDTSSSIYATGAAGEIKFTADTLSLNQGAYLDASTFGEGDAGSVKLMIRGAATFDGGSRIYSQVEEKAVGKAGGIEIQADSLTITNGAFLTASTLGEGDAGGIKITADTLTVSQGAYLDTSTFGQGDAGSVKLTIRGTAIFDGTDSAAYSRVEPGAVGEAGGIEIRAGSLVVTNGAFLTVSTLGEGDAGNITVNTPLIQLTGSTSGLFARTGSSGKAGNVILKPLAGGQTLSVLFQDGAQISASTTGNRPGGNIIVTAPQTITLAGQGKVAVETTGKGNAGKIDLTTQKLTLKDGVNLSASTSSHGNAGDITMTADHFDLLTGAWVSTSTSGHGTAGNIIITAPQSITIAGAGKLQVGTSSTGNGGNIHLKTQQLTLQDRGEISASTSGDGRAGNVQMTAETFHLSQDAKVSSNTSGTGLGGNIILQGTSLNAFSGAQLTTNTSGKGNAGSIEINLVDTLALSGTGTGLFAITSQNSTGNGGSIIIDPRLVRIQDGAKIAVDSQGSGTGGSISLVAGKLELSDRASITAETASTQGGNITLDVKDMLVLRRNSAISATAGTAQAPGNGGNITIRTSFIISVLGENNDITANAFTGNGGKINITTNGIYGLLFQPQLTPFSDITVSSQFGLSGTVAISILSTDINRGLVTLPGKLTEPINQIRPTCTSNKRRNQFVITGRGGIPESPDEMFSGDRTLTPLLDPIPSTTQSPQTQSPQTHAPSPMPHFEFNHVPHSWDLRSNQIPGCE